MLLNGARLTLTKIMLLLFSSVGCKSNVDMVHLEEGEIAPFSGYLIDDLSVEKYLAPKVILDGVE